MAKNTNKIKYVYIVQSYFGTGSWNIEEVYDTKAAAEAYVAKKTSLDGQRRAIEVFRTNTASCANRSAVKRLQGERFEK